MKLDLQRTHSLWDWVKRDGAKLYPRDHFLLRGHRGRTLNPRAEDHLLTRIMVGACPGIIIDVLVMAL